MNKTVKNIFIRMSMLVVFSLFIVLVVVAKFKRDETTVKEIHVSIDDDNGIFLVSKSQVLNLVERRFVVKNKKLTGKELEKIEKSICVIPQVKTTNAFTDDNGNLNIKIVQRNPVLRVYNLQGNSYYIDDNGLKFASTDNYAVKVPIVSGNIVESCDTIEQMKSQELESIFAIAQAINKNKLWKVMIGQYNINTQNQIELIPRFGEATIIFGDDKNIEQKLQRLDIFYFDVLKKVGWDYYKVINIMYKDQVVCLK